MSDPDSCVSMDDVHQVRRFCVDLFTNHPHKAGESYCQHFAYAGFTGVKLVGLGLVSIVHGLCPFLFTSTVSEHVPALSKELKERRRHVQTGHRHEPKPSDLVSKEPVAQTLSAKPVSNLHRTTSVDSGLDKHD